MSETQFYIAVVAPMLFNGALIGFVVLWARARFDAIDARFGAVDTRFTGLENSMDARFDAIDQRFDDMRDLWRAELHRVEEVLDARLKHLEERHS